MAPDGRFVPNLLYLYEIVVISPQTIICSCGVEMSPLFSLNLSSCAEIFGEWCGVENLMKFDSAICNLQFRPVYLKLIVLPSFVMKSASFGSAICWLCIRKIKCRQIDLHNSDPYLLRYLSLNISKVDQLTFTNVKETLTAVGPFINSCLKLKSLKFTTCASPTEENNLFINSKIFKQLTQLSLNDCKLDENYLLPEISNHCTKLKTFEYSSEDPYPSAKPFRELVTKNKSLENLSFIVHRKEDYTDSFTFTDIFLGEIYASCKNLKSLTIMNDKQFTIGNIKNLFTSCTAMTRCFLQAYHSNVLSQSFKYKSKTDKVSLKVEGPWNENYILGLLTLAPFTSLTFEKLLLCSNLVIDYITKHLCTTLTEFVCSESVVCGFSLESVQEMVAACTKLNKLCFTPDRTWDIEEYLDLVNAENILRNR